MMISLTSVMQLRLVFLVFLALGCIGMLSVAFFLFRQSLRIQKEMQSEIQMAHTEPDAIRSPQKNIAAMRQICSPNALDPTNLGYIVLADGNGKAGNQVYVRSFSIVALPKKMEFLRTLSPLLNFRNCTSSIYIREADREKLRKSHDRYLDVLESEITVAASNLETNRERRLREELRDVTEQASDYESGREEIFECAFLFTLREYSLVDLNASADRFIQEAKKANIAVAICYGLQPEAFLMQTPLNQKFQALNNRTNVFKMSFTNVPFKSFYLKQSALSTIFNYSQNPYYHENGQYIGKNMSDGSIISWDPFDSSHDSYSAIFAGMTGTGKSATVKSAVSRFSDHMRFAGVDSQCPKGLTEGEYNALARQLNGKVYKIAANAKDGNILNIFELEPIYEITRDLKGQVQEERPTLDLSGKLQELKNLFLMMMTYDDVSQATVTLELQSAIQECVIDACTKLYEQKGIRDGDAESLFTVDVYRKTKKLLPTITDFYVEILYQFTVTRDSIKKSALQTILSTLKENVRELYYYIEDNKLHTLTAAEYEACSENDHADKITKKGTVITKIRGSRSYYDGQSRINFDQKCRFINIDISSLPQSELNLARVIAMNYINEHFVKARRSSKDNINSCVIYDEAHQLFDNKYARALLAMQYRTARKQEVSLWILVQSLCDFKEYPETVAILENTQNKFLFRHEEKTKEYVQQYTKMSDSQFAKLTSIGTSPSEKDENLKNLHRGEMCIVDGRSVYFCKADYIRSVERAFVETNAAELRKMAAGEQ